MGLIYCFGSTWWERNKNASGLEEAEKLVDRVIIRRSGVKGNVVMRNRQERRIVIQEYVMTQEMLSRWDQNEDNSDSSVSSDDKNGASSDISFNPMADVLTEMEEERMLEEEPEVEVLNITEADKMEKEANGEAASEDAMEIIVIDKKSDDGSEISYKPWVDLLNKPSGGVSEAVSEVSWDSIEEMIKRMDEDESSDSKRN